MKETMKKAINLNAEQTTVQNTEQAIIQNTEQATDKNIEYNIKRNTNSTYDSENNKDKILSGLPYLYRKNGLPSEIYDVRLKKEVDGNLLNLAIEDALIIHPYFNVKLEEINGEFYAVKNSFPLYAIKSKKDIPLGGRSNNYHLLGITYFDKTIKLAFHHGLTDGRGAKSFLETLINFYNDYVKMPDYKRARNLHTYAVSDVASNVWADPCISKYEINKENTKIAGLSGNGFKLPESSNKMAHRRYEIKFSQADFMDACKKNSASPIILLSILMSQAIKRLNPDCKKPIVSNFPMDAL